MRYRVVTITAGGYTDYGIASSSNSECYHFRRNSSRCEY